MVFGNDCAEAAKIENKEEIETRRRIRERINAGLKNGSQKAGCHCAKVQDRIPFPFLRPTSYLLLSLRRGRTCRNKVRALVEPQLFVEFRSRIFRLPGTNAEPVESLRP